MEKYKEESLLDGHKDPFLDFLNQVVIFCVRILALLMVVVIIWAMVDVIVFIIEQARLIPDSFFKIDSLFSTLGLFLAVLIAIEIFMNIVFYLKKDAVNVPLVLGTALTAIARKVIIFDYSSGSVDMMYATAAVVFSLGLTYWLVTKRES